MAFLEIWDIHTSIPAPCGFFCRLPPTKSHLIICSVGTRMAPYTFVWVGTTKLCSGVLDDPFSYISPVIINYYQFIILRPPKPHPMLLGMNQRSAACKVCALITGSCLQTYRSFFLLPEQRILPASPAEHPRSGLRKGQWWVISCSFIYFLVKAR